MTRALLLAALLAVCGVVGWRWGRREVRVAEGTTYPPEGDVGRGGWFV